MVKDQPKTEGDDPLAALKGSLNKAAHGSTEKQFGPKEETARRVARFATACAPSWPEPTPTPHRKVPTRHRVEPFSLGELFDGPNLFSYALAAAHEHWSTLFTEGRVKLGMATEAGWVGVDEVAAHLRVAKESVYRWIDSKGFPAHRVGRLLRFKLSEVDEWVQDSGADESDAHSPKKGTGRKPANRKLNFKKKGRHG